MTGVCQLTISASSRRCWQEQCLELELHQSTDRLVSVSARHDAFDCKGNVAQKLSNQAISRGCLRNNERKQKNKVITRNTRKKVQNMREVQSRVSKGHSGKDRQYYRVWWTVNWKYRPLVVTTNIELDRHTSWMLRLFTIFGLWPWPLSPFCPKLRNHQ